ncbi:MAG: RNA methyltransferase [Clostridiales bacterium]|nr:RNA methyltransferase [Clostridiales bacterium]
MIKENRAPAVPALPDAFLCMIEDQLGERRTAFLESYNEKPCRGARLYTQLTPADAGDGVPWCENGVYLPLETEAGAGVLHEAGAWYMQEPSAMAPAAVLPLERGDRVLDLCAAPGGKTTQLAQRLRDGLLVANEIVPSRAEILSSNTERVGCRNVIVISASPELLAEKWPETFDKILADAPCSGEGMFRRHPETRSEWTPDSPPLCARRQTDILNSVYAMLKPGGMMVYSTCTFNLIENEGVIARFLDKYPDMSLVPFSLPGIGGCEGSMHLYPDQVRGEGHFVALLRKEKADAGKYEDEGKRPDRPGKGRRGGAPAGDIIPLDREQQRLWEQFAGQYLEEKLSADGLFMGRAVHLPAGQPLPPLKGIRVLRCGIHLGEFRGKVFVPDHALSHAVSCRRKAELSLEQACAYLRGETVDVSRMRFPDGDMNGYCTPVYRGLQLGWGKISEGIMKNHYPKGLRKNLSRE